jgi:Mce-associated membrane protein
MSESNSTPTGRVRRRASRQAGAPTDAIAVERTESALSDEATVKLGAASAADETVQSSSISQAKATESSSEVASKAVSGADAKSETTVKLSTAADDDTTVRLTDSPEDTAAADTSEPPKRSLGPLGWAAAVVAVLSLILLVGSGGFFAYHQHQVSAQADQRAEYVQTAKQAILNLTNIKDDTAKQDIDRVLSVASGQLKQEYSERKDAYAQVVQQAKVKASGEIIETAVESQDDHTAKVLVAAKQTLTNAGAKDPQERYYRFRVTVDRDDNGGITASQVEFVA